MLIMKRNYLILLFTALVLLACAPSQIMKTSLRITVLNELGNPVEGAKVLLYNTEADYRNSENPVAEVAVTNNKGVANVKDLETKAYFIDVRKGDQNNHGGGIQTNVLQSGRINKINVIIE